MRRLPQPQDPRLLVGSNTADDAGVYRLDRNRALVQTVDFFTPIVDDPDAYGQIAAANALSDVYAMGGKPLTALNLLGVPTDAVPIKIIAAILKGGGRKVAEAGCALVGGHTIRNPEPIYGLSVTGLVHPGRMITNAAALPGDWLVLTKPLGTGIVSTAIKRGTASPTLARRAVRFMKQLNRAGSTLAENRLVKAGTDVTGFGLLGHLGSLCRASNVGAELSAPAIPAISPEVHHLIDEDCIPGGTRQNLEAAEPFVAWGNTPLSTKFLLADAQTSGGLLLCVASRHREAVLAELQRHRTACAAVIGRITRSSHPLIRVLA